MLKRKFELVFGGLLLLCVVSILGSAQMERDYAQLLRSEEPEVRSAALSSALTDSPVAAVRRAHSQRSTSSEKASNALPWPAESSPRSTISWTSGGNLSKRSEFATVLRSIPTRSAISC